MSSAPAAIVCLGKSCAITDPGMGSQAPVGVANEPEGQAWQEAPPGTALQPCWFSRHLDRMVSQSGPCGPPLVDPPPEGLHPARRRRSARDRAKPRLGRDMGISSPNEFTPG